MTNIKATDHPEYPIRNVLLCQDSSVRIMSPTTGDIITTLLMPARRKLIDATYAVADETLFAVFGNGDIIKADTSVNPCKIVAEWKCKDFASKFYYILIYIINGDIIKADTSVNPCKVVAEWKCKDFASKFYFILER